MQFFFDVRVRHEDMTIEQLWEIWAKEADAAHEGIQAGQFQLWKVAGQRRVVGVADFDSADELDRAFMAALPMAHVLEFEEIVPVRPYQAFAEDVRSKWAAAVG
jgi:muconolactone D-isomerase